MHTLDAEPLLQPTEQDIRHIGNHLPLDRRSVSLLQQGHDSGALQKVEELIQHRPFIQAVHPIDLLLAAQAPCHARIVPPGHLPPQPLGHVLGALVMCLSHRPPPSTDTVSAIEERGRQIKASAYVGISD
jgi:hypothetical protein